MNNLTKKDIWFGYAWWDYGIASLSILKSSKCKLQDEVTKMKALSSAHGSWLINIKDIVSVDWVHYSTKMNPLLGCGRVAGARDDLVIRKLEAHENCQSVFLNREADDLVIETLNDTIRDARRCDAFKEVMDSHFIKTLLFTRSAGTIAALCPFISKCIPPKETIRVALYNAWDLEIKSWSVNRNGTPGSCCFYNWVPNVVPVYNWAANRRSFLTDNTYTGKIPTRFLLKKIVRSKNKMCRGSKKYRFISETTFYRGGGKIKKRKRKVKFLLGHVNRKMVIVDSYDLKGRIVKTKTDRCRLDFYYSDRARTAIKRKQKWSGKKRKNKTNNSQKIIVKELYNSGLHSMYSLKILRTKEGKIYHCNYRSADGKKVVLFVAGRLAKDNFGAYVAWGNYEGLKGYFLRDGVEFKDVATYADSKVGPSILPNASHPYRLEEKFLGEFFLERIKKLPRQQLQYHITAQRRYKNGYLLRNT